jgi:hypothetical protein
MDRVDRSARRRANTELDPGNYRVLAHSGKLSTPSRLGNSDSSRTCELKLRTCDPRGTAAKRMPEIVAKKFPHVPLNEFRSMCSNLATGGWRGVRNRADCWQFPWFFECVAAGVESRKNEYEDRSSQKRSEIGAHGYE